jgi:hypothetical protein
MLKQALLFVAVAILAVVIFVTAIQIFVPSFQACLSQSVLPNTSLGETAKVYVYCSGNFFSENYGGISALWLLPLAPVTQDLVWADREAAPRRRRGSRTTGASGETS